MAVTVSVEYNIYNGPLIILKCFLFHNNENIISYILDLF